MSQKKPYDLIIKNGRVIDPVTRQISEKDLYIRGECFAEPSSCVETPDALSTINAAGCYVSPGFVDAHGHYYQGGSELGGNADLVAPPNGVTTVIDAGTAGIHNFEDFYSSVILRTTTTIKAALSITTTGVQMPPHEEIQDPAVCDIDKIRRIFKKYQRTLVGLKVRVHRDVTGPYGLTALKAASRAAKHLREEGYSCHLMVHYGELAEDITLKQVLECLDPGDVLTHIYRTGNSTIFDESGHVMDCVRQARRRGVILESGCARSHCSLESIKKAMAQDFPPAIISTDLIGKTFYWKPSFSLAYKMSIYLNAGMDLLDVVSAVTSVPAKNYGIMEEAGTLEFGRPADAAIFKIIDYDFCAGDLYGGTLSGSRLLVPMATVKRGAVIFQQVFL